MKNSIMLDIVEMPSLGTGVKGKRVDPSIPFDPRKDGGERWKTTDLDRTFRNARGECDRLNLERLEQIHAAAEATDDPAALRAMLMPVLLGAIKQARKRATQ